MTDPVWDELGKIDYLLDQLARAVERGEVDWSAYDRFAPRYLARRAELSAVLTGRASRTVAASSAAPSSAGVMPTSAYVPITSAPMTAAHAPYAPTPAAAVLERAPVSAGAWMTYAGAFLVVVAVAIFTIYAWGYMPSLAKLAVLAVVTAAFYAGGDVIRTRLGLPAVGVALIGVASAMLLFDGWAVINGYGLTGALPWAVLLLVCSLAYWVTERRIAGGWFGAVGAAAQIGWWWMLGQALLVGAVWQIAGIAVVSVLWRLGGERVRENGALGALGSVLRAGAVVVAVVASLGMLPALAAHPGSVSSLVAAIVTAVAATVVIERSAPAMKRLAAAAHIPVVVASVSLWSSASGGHASTDVVVVLGLLALAWGLYALWRGGTGYALLAALALTLTSIALADDLSLTAKPTLAVVATVFAALACAGHLTAHRGTGEHPLAHEVGVLWKWAGLLLLVPATLAVPLSSQAIPLSGMAITRGHVALAAGVLGLWIAAAAVTRVRMSGWAVASWSFYVVAALSAFALPHLHSAWYALILVALAAAWDQARRPAARVLRLDAPVVTVIARGLYLLIPLAGVAGAAVFFSTKAYPVAVLLAGVALAWATDAMRDRSRAALTPASAFGVVAVAVAAWVRFDAPAAAVAGAVTALAFALAGAMGPRTRDGWGAFLAAGGVVPAMIVSVAAFDVGGTLTGVLLLIAAAWGLIAIAAALPAGFFGTGLFASFALVAALSWRDPAPWVTLLSMAALSGALVLPRVLVSGGDRPKLRNAARALAIAGLATAGQLAILGAASWAIRGTSMGTHAFETGEAGIALGFALAGVATVTLSVIEDFEPGRYAGWFAVTLGLLFGAHTAGLRQAEFFLLGLAAYSAAMGWLWSRRGPDREVPVASDALTCLLGVAAPFLLSLAATDPSRSLEHGLWALGLAVVAVVAGMVFRSRSYFLGGIAIAGLDALWLSRSVLLALPAWVWIGLAGLALIGGGVTFARRELLGAASRRVSQGLADWR